MPGFLALMIIGIIGLVLMAIPGLNRHGSSGHIGGHGPLHLGHGAAHGHAGAHTNTAHSAQGAANQAVQPGGIASILRWIPSPRSIFSLMTLYGGAGLALTDAAHLSKPIAAVLALIPAILIEKYAITPFWNSMMTFEGIPSSPLEALTYQQAEAVTQFRNGKGMVTVVRDGRAVQLLATLPADQTAIPVRVGDKLRIEQVDSEHERVTVSLNV